jgi:DNA invertase Pin-like site-specific DNA recombinase
MTANPRVAMYTRVSTDQQTTENQRRELAAYLAARGWQQTREYCDQGVSGSLERRPALDELLHDARRRKFDVLVCWRLDRLGRNLKHLITLLDELRSLGVEFVSIGEGIDCTTPAGRLQLHLLGALAEFERDRITERIRAGMNRRKAAGKPLGRPRQTISTDDLSRTIALSTRKAAALLGVSHAAVNRARTRLSQKVPKSTDENSNKTGSQNEGRTLSR